ncbi:MAG: tryptophan--tRNA ligase [Puniceicoccales bacterium]|jgi:tryptophanyl-tRNA synthetase|nr:tryptophan--tRNA ligase [Puniceicoccales bacterium]
MGMEKKIIVTGAQPTGGFHLGNYLGAVKNWCSLQEDFECFFFIPNLHAITCPSYSPTELRHNTIQMLAQFMACGLDPKKSHMFIQSSITGHTELAWILGCLTPVGQLFRMTQFKAKSEQKDFVGSGLLYYPILMAADILLYNAHLVPVGEDQKQHVELARDLAVKFNQTYGATFNVPEPYILKTGARVYSLQEPTKKMSKSDPNQKGTIFIFEPIDGIRKKIRSAVTDSGMGITFSKNKPGIANLMDIFAALTGLTVETVEAEYGTHSYSDFKNCVAEAVIEHLKPLQACYFELLKDKEYLNAVLEDSKKVAQAHASRMMAKVYRRVGLF